MNLRQYLILLSLGTATSLSAWCIILLFIDPVHAGALAYVVFYFTLLSGVAGLLTTLGTLARAKKYGDDDHIGGAVARSFRQALLLTALLGGSLFLISRDAFSTLTAFLVVLLFGFIEFLFLTFQKAE